MPPAEGNESSDENIGEGNKTIEPLKHIREQSVEKSAQWQKAEKQLEEERPLKYRRGRSPKDSHDWQEKVDALNDRKELAKIERKLDGLKGKSSLYELADKIDAFPQISSSELKEIKNSVRNELELDGLISRRAVTLTVTIYESGRKQINVVDEETGKRIGVVDIDRSIPSFVAGMARFDHVIEKLIKN